MQGEYVISYEEDVAIEEESVLFEGIVQAAVANGISRMRPFAFS